MQNNTWKKITGIAIFLSLILLSVFSLIEKDIRVSETERRSLSKIPKLSAEAVGNGEYMRDMEDYLLDHFAFRDTFRTLKSEFETRVLQKADSNGYYLADGAICKLDQELNEQNINRAASGFGQICDTYFTDAAIYLSVIPDKNYFASRIMGYPSMREEKLIEKVQRWMPEAAYIDVSSLLELSDYYRTDIHWRQECMIDIADEFLFQMAGYHGNQKEMYEQVQKTDAFFGGTAGASSFRTKPDELNYLTNDIILNASVYDFEKESEVPVYETDLLEGGDPYDLFLWGARALLTIKNGAQESGRRLIIFRDSFGSSLTPLLLPGYSEITLVDLRYVSAEYAMKKLGTDGYDDVLFLYSSTILNHSESLKL